MLDIHTMGSIHNVNDTWLRRYAIIDIQPRGSIHNVHDTWLVSIEARCKGPELPETQLVWHSRNETIRTVRLIFG